MDNRVDRVAKSIRKKQKDLADRLRRSIQRRLARGLNPRQEARFQIRAGMLTPTIESVRRECVRQGFRATFKRCLLFGKITKIKRKNLSPILDTSEQVQGYLILCKI